MADSEFDWKTEAEPAFDWKTEAAPSGAPVAAEPPRREPMGRLEAMGRGAAQGATFGFGDEISGGIQAGVDKLRVGGEFPYVHTDGSDKSWGDLYRRNRDLSRRDDARAAEDHPVYYHGASIAGSIPGAFVAPAGKIGMMGLGALQGIGNSNESSIGEIAKDSVEGAGTGLVLGGVAGKIGQGLSSLKGAVGRMIAAKLAQQEGNVLSKAAEAGPRWSAPSKPQLPADAGGEISMSGEHPPGLRELAAEELPSVASRQSRQGGEVNAALNNAQNMVAKAQARSSMVGPNASPEEAEAAQLLAGRMRQFSNANPRATPRYQNSGELTNIAPIGDIAGARAPGQSARPVAPARQPVIQRRPQIRPEWQEQSAYGEGQPTAAARGQHTEAGDMETMLHDGMAPEPTPIGGGHDVTSSIIAPRPMVREQFRNQRIGPVPGESTSVLPPQDATPVLPARGGDTPGEDGAFLPSREGAIQGALQNPANQAGGNLAMGALKGAIHGAKGGGYAALPIALANHTLGGATEGLATVGGAAKGAYGAMSEAQKLQLLKSAQGAFETPEWRANIYRQILSKDKVSNQTANVASGSYGNQDDRRD